MLDARQGRGSWPTVEEIQDLVEKALVERGHARTAKAYILYRYEHALKREGKASLTYSEENIPYRKLWRPCHGQTRAPLIVVVHLSRSMSRRDDDSSAGKASSPPAASKLAFVEGITAAMRIRVPVPTAISRDSWKG